MWARGGIKISSLSEVRLKVIISCDVELKVIIFSHVGHQVQMSHDAALKINVNCPCAR